MINEKILDKMTVELQNNTFNRNDYPDLSSLSFMTHLQLAKKQACLKPLVYITYIGEDITNVLIACSKSELPKENFEVFAVCEGLDTAQNIQEKLKRYLRIK